MERIEIKTLNPATGNDRSHGPDRGTLDGKEPFVGGSPLNIVAKEPLNGEESMYAWHLRSAPHEGSVEETKQHIDEMSRLLSKDYPLRAHRLKMNLSSAVRASEVVGATERKAEDRLQARHAGTAADIADLDARIICLRDDREAKQAEVERLERELAAAAGEARVLTDLPLGNVLTAVKDGISFAQAWGREVSGMRLRVPAERKEDVSLSERAKEFLLGWIAPVFLGTMLGILVMTVVVGFRLTELRHPDTVTYVKLAIGIGVGIFTDFLYVAYAKKTATVLAMYRDGRTPDDGYDSRRDGGTVAALVIFLLLVLAGTCVLEGIGMRDLHEQSSRLSGTKDTLPLFAYCLFAGSITMVFVLSAFASETARHTNRRRAAVEDSHCFTYRQAWVSSGPANDVIRIARLIDAARAALAAVESLLARLQDERLALALPGHDPATMAYIHDLERSARGERMDSMAELDEIVEAIEPLP